MGGGLMQLVAYGAQDVYLTGNPQITFWKVVYRRHTNFAMESIEQTFNGQVDFGRKVTCTISRNGDLIHRVYLQVTLPEVNVPTRTGANVTSVSTTSTDKEDQCYFRWVNYIGHALIRSVEVEIGGQRIDKHYGDWLNIWNELTQEPGHQVGYDNMVGNNLLLTGAGLKHVEATTLYVPLQFWFCRNPGLALPLIALQYHEVRINMEFRAKEECYLVNSQGDGTGECCVQNCATGSGGDKNCICVPPLQYASLFVDYIYLDTDERRRFAQVSHEYLIEQLQFTGDESVTSTNVKVKLNFNHPCKELVWVVQRDDVSSYWKQWSNYTDDVDRDANIESGFAAQSFPLLLGAGTGHNGLGEAKSLFGGASALNLGTMATELGLTPSQLQVALGTNWNTGGPGSVAASGSAINMGTTDAGQGVDHAGMGPVRAGRNPVIRAKLQLNGHDRFQERLGSYFNLVQPYQHHTNVPATGINVYSFALKPEEHQPSGTCNMSRIDSAVLQLQLTPKAAGQFSGDEGQHNVGSKIRVYATNYNVLRIMSGMGGLAYSN